MEFEKTTIGCKEIVKIGINDNIYQFTATMDTGNSGIVPTLGVDNLLINKEKNEVQIYIKGNKYILEKKGESTPMVGNVMHRRPIIIIDFIEIAGKKMHNIPCAVTDNRNKSTQMLINKDLMIKMNFIIDPSIENI